jgi:hypothetical protein
MIGTRGVYRGTSCYELASKDHAQPRSGPHPASILNAKAMAPAHFTPRNLTPGAAKGRPGRTARAHHLHAL